LPAFVEEMWCDFAAAAAFAELAAAFVRAPAFAGAFAAPAAFVAGGLAAAATFAGGFAGALAAAAAFAGGFAGALAAAAAFAGGFAGALAAAAFAEGAPSVGLGVPDPFLAELAAGLPERAVVGLAALELSNAWDLAPVATFDVFLASVVAFAGGFEGAFTAALTEAFGADLGTASWAAFATDFPDDTAAFLAKAAFPDAFEAVAFTTAPLIASAAIVGTIGIEPSSGGEGARG